MAKINKASERGCYKGEDGKWYEPNGTRYSTKNSPEGEQAPWLFGKDITSRPDDRSTGRGPTSLVSLAKHWRDEDDPVVTKKQLQDIYKTMLGRSRREIEQVARDKNAPLAVTVLAESLLDEKTRAKTLADTQQWLWGRAVEEIKVTKQTDVTPEEEEAILKVVGKNY